MGDVLLFFAGPVRCAIPIADTDSAIRMVRSEEPEAGTPPWDAGTINLHGNLVTVLAMRALFGLPVPEPSFSEMLIIVRAGDRTIALRVDAIAETRAQPPAPDESKPVGDSKTDLPGIFETPDGLHVIQDVSGLLDALAKRSDLPLTSCPPEIWRGLPEDSKQLSEPRARTDGSSSMMLLEERARILALPGDHGTGKKTKEILKFRLANREFGIALSYIREVVLTGKITRVPGTPEYIAGICIIRGEIISLVDLRILLPIPHTGITDLNRVIVISGNNLTIGILADQITGIGEMDLDHLEHVHKDSGTKQTILVNHVQDGSLYLLDAETLVSDPRMIIDES